MKTYVNYHKHSYYSNAFVQDSTVSVEQYLERIAELGHKAYSTCEHGYMGMFYNHYLEIESFNKKRISKGLEPIRIVVGCEAYWTKNRFEKDKSNGHIILLAKNNNGRKAINRITSQANKDGYYYKPRVDLELLMSLPSKDVFVTTACLAFNKYKDIEDIILKLNNKFEDFYLEVQPHNTEKQKERNKYLLELSRKHGIPIICGCDSHMIYESQAIERDDYLKSYKISYEDEFGWYLDYPDYDTLFKRFQEQGVLSDKDIEMAMDNTNKILEFEDIILDKSIKLPNVYPNMTQEERNNFFVNMIYDKWNKEKQNIPKSRWKTYEKEIKKEIDEIIGCNMADYFLLNERIVNLGIEKYGGVLTHSSRGSAGGCYIGKLLGFTNIDRIVAPVTLIFERFLTKDRILKSKSLVDIDWNVADRQPFIKAQKELLGEKSSYDLLAFSTLKTKAAFKLYCRACNVNPDEANEVSKQIDKYEEKLKYAERDEMGELLEDIIIEDFVEPKYLHFIEESKKYLGIKTNARPHPCFLKDELVMTNKGYKKIQDIADGDFVLTHNNRFKPVLYIMKSFSNDIYKIKGTGIFETKVTGNHPYYVRKKINKHRKEKSCESPKWIKVEDIKEKDYIGIAINQKSNLPNSELELPFESSDFWWIIGRFIGDGWLEECIRKEIKTNKRISKWTERRLVICCNKTTDDELNEIISHIERIGFDYRFREERTTYKIFIKNKELQMYVRQFGKYAHNKKLTNDIFDLPIELLKDFIEGYISADGCILGNEYKLTTTSKELALGFSACVNKAYHKYCNITKRNPRVDIIEGREVKAKESYSLTFRKEVLENERGFFEDNHIWLPVTHIEKINSRERVYNLKVLDDESYTVNNAIVHNCGFCTTSLNLEEEIGIIKVKSEASKNEVLCVCIESGDMDAFQFVKEDFLKVEVVKTTDEIYKRIGIKQPSVSELLDIIEDNDKVWNIYKNGYTLGVNQVEQEGSKKKCIKYKPTNIVELTAFIAAIRPSFKSLVNKFLSREPFEYGIKELDELLQTEEMPYSYIFYQEQLMNILEFAGFPMKETYDIIKMISKKKTYCTHCGTIGNDGMKICPSCKGIAIKPLVDKYKDQFVEGFMKKTNTTDSFVALKVYQIVVDFARYGFNASHSYAMALDSTEQAYLKAYYPGEFYEVMLKTYTAKGEKDKVNAFKEEMKHFGIKLGKIEFGEDNRGFKYIPKTNTITQSIVAFKNINQMTADALYRLDQETYYENFIELLVDMKDVPALTKRTIEPLIEMGYFSKFGNIEYLKKCYKVFEAFYGKKQFSKTHEYSYIIKKYAKTETEKLYKDVNVTRVIYDIMGNFDKEVSKLEQIICDFKRYGATDKTLFNFDNKVYIILDIDTKYSPKITLYNPHTGGTQLVKMNKTTFEQLDLKIYDCIEHLKVQRKKKTKKKGNNFVPVDGYDFWLDSCNIITKLS